MSASYRSCPTAGARRTGFTLIELLVVILVIGILMALLFPAVRSVQQGVYETTVTTDIVQLEAAIERFKDEFGFYPSDFSEFVKTDGSVFEFNETGVFGDATLSPAIRLRQMLAKISPSNNELINTGGGVYGGPLLGWWNTVGKALASRQDAAKEFSLRGPQVAMWFWLTQLFNDAQYPITGPRIGNDPTANLAEVEQRQFFDFNPSQLEVIAEISDAFGPGSTYEIARVVQSRSEASILYFHNDTYLDPYSGTDPTFINFGADDLSGAPNLGCACREPSPNNGLTPWISPASFQILAPGYDESFGDVGDFDVYASYDNLTNFGPGRLDGYVEDFLESNQ